MNARADSLPIQTGIQSSKALHAGLWLAQGLLAAVFAASGLMKAATPIEVLSQKMDWVAYLPELTRFIGASELAGAVGLLLPSLTRVRPRLTALAGAGLALVMALAGVFHLMRGELGALPVNVLLGGLAAFVAWGRYRGAPITAR